MEFCIYIMGIYGYIYVYGWKAFYSSVHLLRASSYHSFFQKYYEQLLWKTVWRFLKKLKIELPYDPEIPLLGIYLKERNHYLTALFAIAKTWKQTSVHWQTNGKRKYAMCVYTHPPTHNGTFIIIQKYWLLFERKKSFICDSMHGPWGHYLKRNKSEKDKYCMISLICGI